MATIDQRERVAAEHPDSATLKAGGDAGLPEHSDAAYRRAKARVDTLRRFYGHLTTYIVVNLCLFLINIAFDRDDLWFLWVLIIWGIFVVLEMVSIFAFRPRFDQDWEERKIREYLDRDRDRQR